MSLHAHIGHAERFMHGHEGMHTGYMVTAVCFEESDWWWWSAVCSWIVGEMWGGVWLGVVSSVFLDCWGNVGRSRGWGWSAVCSWIVGEMWGGVWLGVVSSVFLDCWGNVGRSMAGGGQHGVLECLGKYVGAISCTPLDVNLQ